MTNYWQLMPTVLFCFVALSLQVLPAPIDPSDISVIDGDTIRVYHKQPNVRLVGFNAPETRKARCNGERGLGARATRRVRDLVRDGNLDFEFVACSCAPGTEGSGFRHFLISGRMGIRFILQAYG